MKREQDQPDGHMQDDRDGTGPRKARRADRLAIAHLQKREQRQDPEAQEADGKHAARNAACGTQGPLHRETMARGSASNSPLAISRYQQSGIRGTGMDQGERTRVWGK